MSKIFVNKHFINKRTQFFDNEAEKNLKKSKKTSKITSFILKFVLNFV